ncbi:MAG: hypothetical protein EA402_08405, partial [Planctomycetota bacterium]
LTRAPRDERGLRVEILDPRDSLVAHHISTAQEGMFGLRWDTSTISRGGTYTMRVRSTDQEDAPWSSRSFHIADHRQQRVSASIDFAQDSVAPGETLEFTVKASPLNANAAQPTRIRVSGVVDGAMVLAQSWDAGESTSHAISIRIPDQVRLGGSLAVTIDDNRGGSTTVARSLPIAVSGVQVETRIPGGGLVAGLPARVYAQARLPDGRPASLQARIINAAGESVAELASEHEGRGRSTFTPIAGEVYRLRIDAPLGLDDINLGRAQDEGVSLHGSSDAQAAGEDMRLRLAALPAQRAVLELRRAGILLQQQPVDLGTQGKEVRLAEIQADGVLEAVLRNPAGEVLATRRIFRHPDAPLQLHWIEPPQQLREGQSATITLEVRNAQGEPVPDALVSLRLREAGISGLRAQRDRHPSLSSMLLLEQDVAELADPEVYLHGDAAADRRLDLLLSCQGLALVPPPPLDVDETAPEGIAMAPLNPAKGPAPRDERLGREEALSASESGGSGAFMAIGAGGGAAGMFGHRGGGGRWRALGIYGGSRASEGAVEAALRLFARIQEPQGHWRVGDIPAVLPGPPLTMPDGVLGGPSADLKLSAMVTQIYLGSGYDHRTPNRYRRLVHAALQWLIEQAPGTFGAEHDDIDSELLALVARPIVEAYAMTMDPALRQPAQALISRLLREQLRWEDRWLGWGEWEEDEDGNRYPVVDAQLSLQVAMTLHSAQGAGLNAFHERTLGARHTDESLGALRQSMLAAISNGSLPQRWSPARELDAEAAPPMIALRLAAIFNLENIAEPWAQLVNVSDLPGLERVDLLHLLWASEGLFLLSQAHWADWNQRLRDPLIARQRRDDSGWHGLWDIPSPLNDSLGPLASTAVATNILQTYYRYMPHDWRNHRRPHDALFRLSAIHYGAVRQTRRDATWLWTVGRRSDAQGRISMPMRSLGAHGEWELSADVLDAAGNLAQLQDSLAIRSSLALQLRLPHRLVVGDTVSTALIIDGVAEQQVAIEGTQLVQRLTLDSEGLGRIPLQFRAESSPGMPLRIQVQQDSLSERIDTTIPVAQRHAPWRDAHSGRVAMNNEESLTLVVPQHLIGLSAQLQLPRPMGERAQASHAALIRTPHGCFEQTSATTYPLALAHSRASTPENFQRSFSSLQQGYTRLLTFECSGGGFEWFGRGAGHAGLTAFGLVQFHDLAAAGISVDQQMLQRTRQWLLSRIDADSGAVQPSGQPSLHGWDEAGALLDLYVAWALASSSGELPSALLQRLHGLEIAGAWQHSLAAETWARLALPEPARQSLASIHWADDDLVKDPGTAVLRSNALSLRVEASARALISGLLLGDAVTRWLPVYEALLRQERHGRFGSTQATAQSLRALAMVEDRLNKDDLTGTLTLISDHGHSQEIPVGSSHPNTVDIHGLGLGNNQLRIIWQGNDALPWTLDLGGYVEYPDNPADAPLELHIAPLPDSVRLGNAVDLQVRITAHQATPTPMARLGLPAGLLPRPDQLDELVEAGS